MKAKPETKEGGGWISYRKMGRAYRVAHHTLNDTDANGAFNTYLPTVAEVLRRFPGAVKWTGKLADDCWVAKAKGLWLARCAAKAKESAK